ncbi:CD1871A family CXXC motif-containing protein [Peptacetobacter sp.]|nr:CD1871A family CXXC motif-containing protein [Peptacetobacter sp.]
MKLKIILRKTIILVAILFIIIGIHNGDIRDIVNKATRICYECIGIG